ncbi:hypothetical protein HIM_10521 [Hirsutella minnesotensis 3608]|uniref:Heterokaryon incompatibility domain-containing protein n=1 Tax=Hirsutella minnesotensis 3608 TaxID=1043627 RepID=A0A0F8A278_9HYPO|nr:hypothetical protein HIM_10521 [Hirsutella minnesotensis 3608]
MLCNVCCEGLKGIWDPSKTKRVCRMDDFVDVEVHGDDSRFVTVETYKSVKPHDPDYLRPEHHMFGHHVSRQSFEQSVRDGCVMCSSFRPRHIGDEVKADSNIAAFGYYSLFSIEFEDCPIMYMYVNNTRGGFELIRHTVQDDNTNTKISPSTGDDATWRIIQRWLDTCLQAHEACNQRPRVTFCPTRLLRLETANGPEPVFRVVDASQVEPGTRYVTLSHCCGTDDDSIKLTQVTLAQLSSPQPLSVLPLTFKEALAVVNRLGLTHLWIDCLCILQDNALEQDTEASRARHVFSNAFLSIVASGTTSSSGGLFSTRNPALVAPTVFDFPVDAAGTTVPYRSSLEGPRGWRRAFDDDPLSRSGRALEERLRAPRALHFGRKMVFWECHGASCAEVHPRGVNEALGGVGESEGGKDSEAGGKTMQRNKPWKTLLNAPTWRMREDPISQVFADWFAILETYTGCTLTTPEDKLPGLAGVAGDMKMLLHERGFHKTDYVAGIWKAMLPGGLVWNMRESGSRPAAYRAPSWSWAAVDGRINFHDRTPEEASRGLLCKLVGAATTLRTADAMGEVAAGSVMLMGKLALGKLCPVGGNGTVPIKSLVHQDGVTCLAEAKDNREWTVLFDTKEDVADEILCLPIRARTLSNIGCYVDGLALSRLGNGCHVRRGKWGILVNTQDEALGIFQGLPEQEVEIV